MGALAGILENSLKQYSDIVLIGSLCLNHKISRSVRLTLIRNLILEPVGIRVHIMGAWFLLVLPLQQLSLFVSIKWSCKWSCDIIRNFVTDKLLHNYFTFSITTLKPPARAFAASVGHKVIIKTASHPQLHINTVITWTESPEKTSDGVPGIPRDTDAKSNKCMLISGQEEFVWRHR